MDVFREIASHSSANEISALQQLNYEARVASYEHRRFMDLYTTLLSKMKRVWSNKSMLHANGLQATAKEFLTGGTLTCEEILNMHNLIGTRDELQFIRDTHLGEYTRIDGTVIDLTVGSVIDSMTHPSLRTFYYGCAFDLRIYYMTEGGQIYLPVAENEQRFYSWGYADRVGSVGNFEDAPYLTERIARGRG